MRRAIFLFALLLFILYVPAAAQSIERRTISSQGSNRTYYLFVPRSVRAETPAPLLLLLHGSGRNGRSLVERWKELAEREGIILAGPDASDPAQWRVPEDGPDFLRELIDALKSNYPVNARRVYLFGHSAGAGQALLLSLLESEYFAATAIHAGALLPETYPLIERARRKIPISIFVGTNDHLFPLPVVRATRDALNTRGFAAELTEIRGHTHWYYDRAPQINRDAWEFLKRHELAADPRYEQHYFASHRGRSQPVMDAYHRGLERYNAGDMSGAVAAFARTIELDPRFAQAYHNRGIAYLQLRNYQAALADLSRSIELNPAEAAAYGARGGAHRGLRMFREAIADHTRAIELRPTAEEHYNRGLAYEEAGNAELALADYTRAIELNPRFALAYATRGLLLLRQGKDAEAQSDFDTGFRLDSSLRPQFAPHIESIRAARGRN